jgi:membrane protease YdiL (CAAX protease family)
MRCPGMVGTAWGAPKSSPPVSVGRYALGVASTILDVVSQYFVPQLWPATRVVYGNLAGSLLVVYGIPVVVFSALVGAGPLRNWKERMALAGWRGLQWYGGLSVVALVVAIVLAIVYAAVDPSALHLLSRKNPALVQAESDPWFYIGLSFLVGAFEETIFRGWIFGYWRDRRGSWLVPATWTSAVFAGVHLYYGITYGAASPLVYSSLFLTGFAFAAAYRFSGGNLVVPALLHGFHDAAAYFSLISAEGSVLLEWIVILVGCLFALIDYVQTHNRPLERIGAPPGPIG